MKNKKKQQNYHHSPLKNMHPSKALYISKVEMPADVGNSYCDMYLKVLIYLLI